MIDTCACGEVASKGGALCDRCAALHLLGLESGASDDEIKDAFRALAKVWHPDHFESDKTFRTIAEEKFKEFNSAFQLLTTPSSRRIVGKPSQGSSPSAPKPPEPQDQEPHTEWQSASAAAPTPPTLENRSHYNSPPKQRRAIHSQPASVSVGNSGWGRVLPIIATVALIAVVAYVWYHVAARPRKGSVITAQVAGGSAVQRPPVTQRSQTYVPFTKTLPQPSTNREEQDQKTVPNAKSPEPLLKPRPPVIDKGPYFTVGSTKDEVLAIQGKPTQSIEGIQEATDSLKDIFFYGASKVFFRNGVVESWDVWPQNPLKARLLPSTPTSAKGYFTVGSTKDEVLAVQGTPTKFSENFFYYGTSKIYFRNGVVEYWDGWLPNPLKARLAPK